MSSPSPILCCRLDHILLETTGLANPVPLASILWLDDQLKSAVKLDYIITVVDAKNLRLQLSQHRDSSLFTEAYLRIAFAIFTLEISILIIVTMQACNGFISHSNFCKYQK
ncbi:hypothetical protein GIB67_002231 [Kingdonia uniflora]|uniref:CobW/HypB/UreG nucleotide-binding domain-containing protein n=1 Tax=Kingdonia uniflora TaxID=39325 RepID=A0A7J7KWT3_9MAGN|nr:hypothetical protein GIB67_002231 [Kingdonia uniflora]